MHGDHCRGWSRATDGTTPFPLTGWTHNGGQGEVLLHHPVQGLQWVHTGKPVISHHIKYGVRHGYPTLGDSSGRGGLGTIGVCEGGAESGRDILHRR